MTTLRARFAAFVLRIAGWTAVGEVPRTGILVGAPHTSNWDFVMMLLIMWRGGVSPRVLIKQEIFRGPLGWLLPRLGGIPLDRMSTISYGDLSANAEYDAAKNDQAVLEQRIAELKAMIENAVVVDESKISTDVVGFGTRVTIVYEDEPDDEETYTIVGTSESDPANGKLSNESPVGEALIGAHVGEIVIAQTPGGARRLKVIEIAL